MADTPRLTVLCVYPDMSSPPSEVSFRLSPSYGILTAREVHDWFLEMMREHESFEVETDKAGEWSFGGGRLLVSARIVCV